jgi:hypothetical protein
MENDRTTSPVPQSKLQKSKKYRHRNGSPKALKGAASAGTPDKYCQSIRNEAQFRPAPSLAPVAWLSRPDPDHGRGQ